MSAWGTPWVATPWVATARVAAARVAAARDCEAFGVGWLGQPANTISSLAFVLLASWLLARAKRTGDGRLVVFAVTSLAIGLGSVAFHGPHPSWGQWAHDVSIVSALVLAVAFDVDGGGARLLWRWVAATAVAGALLWFWPDTQRWVFGALGVSFGWLELRAVRRRLRPRPGDPAFGQWVFALVVALVGGAAFFLGRAAWACDPSSPLQAHAVWHVSLAAAAAAWVKVAVLPRPGSRGSSRIGG